MSLQSCKSEQIFARPNCLTIFSAIAPFCCVNILRMSISHKNVHNKTRMFLLNKNIIRKTNEEILKYDI